MTTWLAPNSDCFFDIIANPPAFIRARALNQCPAKQSATGKRKVFLFFLRVGDNLSACLVWACILFLMSQPPHQEWSHSFLCLYVSFSCGFGQPHSLEKSYFLKSRGFIQEQSERESAAWSCWLWLGERWASEGAAAGPALRFTARCNDSCKGKESKKTHGSTGKILSCPGKKAYS